MESAQEMDSLLEEVVTEHQAGLLRYATRFLCDPTRAQDVVQEVFIRFCRHWSPAVCPAERLRYWLYSLTHNVAVDHIRKESRQRRLHENHAALGPAAGGASETDRQHRLVLEHLDELPPPERQVLLLRLQHGFSYREIAETTGRTEGNVGCLLHHAVKNMSRILKAQGVIP